LLQQFIGAVGAAKKRESLAGSALLGVTIVALTALAAYALNTGNKDTAEKIVIGLVSFLGGCALLGPAAARSSRMASGSR
jgi:hypothetical protein